MRDLLVAEKLISKGCDVADPLGHNHAYDLLAIKGNKILKIQVKATVESKTRQAKRILGCAWHTVMPESAAWQSGARTGRCRPSGAT